MAAGVFPHFLTKTCRCILSGGGAVRGAAPSQGGNRGRGRSGGAVQAAVRGGGDGEAPPYGA